MHRLLVLLIVLFGLISLTSMGTDSTSSMDKGQTVELSHGYYEVPISLISPIGLSEQLSSIEIGSGKIR
jgi:hypothetical protein